MKECLSCKHYRPDYIKGTKDSYVIIGNCVYNAPVSPQNDAATEFPRMESSDDCSKWEMEWNQTLTQFRVKQPPNTNVAKVAHLRELAEAARLVRNTDYVQIGYRFKGPPPWDIK